MRLEHRIRKLVDIVSFLFGRPLRLTSGSKGRTICVWHTWQPSLMYMSRPANSIGVSGIAKLFLAISSSRTMLGTTHTNEKEATTTVVKIKMTIECVKVFTHHFKPLINKLCLACCTTVYANRFVQIECRENNPNYKQRAIKIVRTTGVLQVHSLYKTVNQFTIFI